MIRALVKEVIEQFQDPKVQRKIETNILSPLINYIIRSVGSYFIIVVVLLLLVVILLAILIYKGYRH